MKELEDKSHPRQTSVSFHMNFKDKHVVYVILSWVPHITRQGFRWEYYLANYRDIICEFDVVPICTTNLPRKTSSDGRGYADVLSSVGGAGEKLGK